MVFTMPTSLVRVRLPAPNDGHCGDSPINANGNLFKACKRHLQKLIPDYDDGTPDVPTKQINLYNRCQQAKQVVHCAAHGFTSHGV